MAEQLRELNYSIEPTFEQKQRIIRLLVDEVTVDVPAGTFKLQGLVRGVFSTDCVYPCGDGYYTNIAALQTTAI